jgi:hypothetical protein
MGVSETGRLKLLYRPVFAAEWSALAFALDVVILF